MFCPGRITSARELLLGGHFVLRLKTDKSDTQWRVFALPFDIPCERFANEWDSLLTPARRASKGFGYWAGVSLARASGWCTTPGGNALKSQSLSKGPFHEQHDLSQS